MPLQPKMLNYENAQFLLIGNAGESGLEKATVPQPEDEKHEKDAPLEEIEKLEHEDELRVEHLEGSDFFFLFLSFLFGSYFSPGSSYKTARTLKLICMVL